MVFLPSECSPTPRNPTLAFVSRLDRNGDHALRRTKAMMAPFCRATERECRPDRCSAIRRSCWSLRRDSPGIPDTALTAWNRTGHCRAGGGVSDHLGA
jgi:hypothetical protein